jgi:hypothetical protein
MPDEDDHTSHDVPIQRTAKGHEIPVPERRRFLRDLFKVAGRKHDDETEGGASDDADTPPRSD